MLQNFSQSLQSVFDLYKQKRNSYFVSVITNLFVFFLFLPSFTSSGQTILSKNQLRYIYNKDTVVYTFDRDISGKLKTVLFTSQNDDKNIKPSTIICTYDDKGLLDQLGGGLMGVEKKEGDNFYFNTQIKIDSKNDSIRVFLANRHLYKSKSRSISNMNTGIKADNFSDSQMIFLGKITSDYIYLNCEGVGCERQLFLFKKVYESKMKSKK